MGARWRRRGAKERDVQLINFEKNCLNPNFCLEKLFVRPFVYDFLYNCCLNPTAEFIQHSKI